jgi:undecaprenyl-diphosphatase
MFDFLRAIDDWIYYQINSVLTHPALDVFFLWITDLHKTPYFKFIAVPLVAFMFIRRFGREGVSLFLFLILALALSDFTGGRIKHLVERQRPQYNLSLQQTQRSVAHGGAFPSNHASNMFTFATYSSYFLPQAGVPLFLLASAVGYSRIYNGVHYPSDVFAGSIMGILWGMLIARIAKQVMNYFRRRKSVE